VSGDELAALARAYRPAEGDASVRREWRLAVGPRADAA